ncbi:MAG TPA: hypothetical protein VF138_01495 [Caulobacteraceae bacterium]
MTLAGLAHEMNNVLARISGSAELALDDAKELKVRQELELILSFVGEGAAIVSKMAAKGA